MTATLFQTTLDTPIGPLVVVASDVGLRAVLWPGDEPDRVPLPTVPAEVAPASHPVLEVAVDQLTAYFDGERTEFDVPLDVPGTDFQQRAWAVLRTIPYGSVMSYGEQAARLGDRQAARAVGAANGRNPVSIVVPCHRVVGSRGELTGFAAGVDTKAWLLDHERAVISRTAPA